MLVGQFNFARRRRLAVLGLLLALSTMGFASGARALGEPSAVVGPPPVPPGMARIWVYREYEPYESLARPYVRLNGAIVAISEPGGAFYRDVAPGAYAITVDSLGTDVNQFATVNVAPGEQAFVKVLASNLWDSGGGGNRGGGYERDTFYTWQIAPPAAEAEMSRLPVYNGG